MKAKVANVKHLLDKLLVATGFTCDFTGLRNLSEKLEFQNIDYFYKKVHMKTKALRGNVYVGLSTYHLNKASEYLGFTSFQEFEASLTGTISEQLASLIGSYYCYVRANAKEGIVLRSPVRIWKKENKIWYELRGPSTTYSGDIALRNGSLFVLMQSPDGKAFHHVYKIGNRQEPPVMQGVFSGVSTAFDPIGGRAVLIRQQSEYAALANKMMKVTAMNKSKVSEERVLAGYFKEYKNNNVAPLRSASFGLMDLRGS